MVPVGARVSLDRYTRRRAVFAVVFTPRLPRNRNPRPRRVLRAPRTVIRLALERRVPRHGLDRFQSQLFQSVEQLSENVGEPRREIGRLARVCGKVVLHTPFLQLGVARVGAR